MKTYQWILFDADETLFHFNAHSGLERTFSQFDLPFSLQDYHDYELLNKALWREYQNGTINSQQLQHQRFEMWTHRLPITPRDFNSAFMATMAQISDPIEGASNLLDALRGKVKIGIITNGFTELQQIRLDRTGLKNHFDLVVVSEEVGFAKPHPAIFEHALALMGNPDREQVLMVGDTLESDILGGINAGLHTCWFNANRRVAPAEITAHYEVSALMEIEKLIFRN